jgi:hypothetical protein
MAFYQPVMNHWRPLQDAVGQLKADPKKPADGEVFAKKVAEAKALVGLLQACQAVLPAPLQAGLLAAAPRRHALMCVAANQSVASKLYQLQASLIDAANDYFTRSPEPGQAELSEVRISTKPASQALYRPAPKVPIPASAGVAIEALIPTVESKPLQAALARLLKQMPR